jgi:hypothetical protein
MAYIPLSDVVGGLSSGFSGASRDIMAIQQARQLAEQRRQAMELAKQEEARAQAEEQRRQAAETAKTALRPLDLAASQYALRGQILGTAKTPEDYATVLGEVNRLGLPTADLPVASSGESTAWKTFTQPKDAPAVVPWLPEKWRPAPILPAPEAQLPIGDQRIGATDMAQVQAAAERGLPIDKQQKFRDQDIGRQIQLANLSRVQDKDALSREWMAFQREAKIQGMTEAETQREFQRRMATLGFGIDLQKLDLQKEQAIREAAKPKINEGQAKAVLFGQEVSASLGDFKNLLGKGFDPTSAKGSASITMAGAEGLAAPLRGLASQDAQIWNNAADQLTQAALRFESGAAIGEQEFGKKIRANVPRMGDSKEVVSRKLQAIDRAARAFEEYSGKTFGGGQPAAPPSAPARSARNQQEFNTIWATLKPGETLQDPNGKTWKKGGAR